MRRELTALFVALAAGVCSAQMPPNAFLVQPADSANAVVRQAKMNPIVMDRYARHFQMTPDQVVRMLSGLHLETLADDTYFDVANVPSTSGELRSRHLLLKKGTKVLSDANGTPVLELSCGNPLTRIDTTSLRQAPAVSKPMDVTAITVPKGGAVETNLSLIQPTTPVTPDVNFVTPPPAGGVVTTETNNAAPFAGLAGLALLPTLLIGLGNGGGGGVPEPATMLILGTGCALIAARVRRRSR